MFNLLPAILILLMNGSLSGEAMDGRLQAALLGNATTRAMIGSLTRHNTDGSVDRKLKLAPARVGIVILLTLTEPQPHSVIDAAEFSERYDYGEPPGIRLTPSHGRQNRSRDGPSLA